MPIDEIKKPSEPDFNENVKITLRRFYVLLKSDGTEENLEAFDWWSALDEAVRKLGGKVWEIREAEPPAHLQKANQEEAMAAADRAAGVRAKMKGRTR